jgi:hypothetical protein
MSADLRWQGDQQRARDGVEADGQVLDGHEFEGLKKIEEANRPDTAKAASTCKARQVQISW